MTPRIDFTQDAGDHRYPALGVGPRIGAVLRGVSVFTPTGQHGPVHVSTAAGVNVLYGLNGAGKSVTLNLLGTLFGTRAASEDIQAFAQVAIEPSALLAVAFEDIGVANVVDQIGEQLMEAFVRRIPSWERDRYESIVNLDHPDFELSASSSFGAVANALVTSAGLGGGIAAAVAEGGRYLLRPRPDRGADVYLGLPVDAPALAAFWAAGESIHERFEEIEPQKPEQPQTKCDWEWLAPALRPDWGTLASSLANSADGTFGVEMAALLIILGHLKAGIDIPAWAAIPMLHIGTIYQERADWEWDFGVVTATTEGTGEGFDQLEEAVRKQVVANAALTNEPLLTALDGHIGLQSSTVAQLGTVSTRATAILHTILGAHSPDLIVEVNAAEGVRTGRPVQIWALDDVNQQTINVRELSDAYRRWALIALRLAFADEFRVAGPANILLLDEPDASLHPLARRALADGLAALVGELGLTAFITTHGVETIDNRQATLWHTTRAAGLVGLTRTSLADLTALNPSELGLRASDLLLMTRAWLVVEGDHDEAVLDAWIGDELRSNLVRMVKMRGTHRALNVIDSQLLFAATDARVIVLTDNTRSSITATLGRALATAVDDRAASLRELNRLLKRARAGSEEHTITDLAIAAIRAGVSDRLTFRGLSKPDIIEYLPADAFVPKSSWPELLAEWKSSDRTKSFKQWLRECRGANVTTKSLRLAAEQADHVPGELTRLASELADAVS